MTYEPLKAVDRSLMPGSNLVTVPALKRVLDYIALAPAAKHLAVLVGQPGVGKTVAAHVFAAKVQCSSHHFSYGIGPRPRTVLSDVLQSMVGFEPTGRTTVDSLISSCVEHCQQGRRLLIFDEVQKFKLDHFNLIRHIYDQADPCSVVLAGGQGAWSVIQRDQSIVSRITFMSEFLPMTDKQVLKALPLWHPLYGNLDSALIAYIDERVTHGNLRAWRIFTERLLALTKREPGEALTEDDIHKTIEFYRYPGGSS